VVIHYNRKTPELDYVGEAYKKVCKIHRQLPPGGILVFLTGQQEIQILVKKLRKEFSQFKMDETVETDEQDSVGLLAETEPLIEEVNEDSDMFDSDFESDDEEEEVQILEGASDDEAENNVKQTAEGGLYVLPLYSMMSNKAQMKIFDPPPAGTRLCVVATNVAETSLTIPGIRYVVDCGKIKEKKYDSYTGIQQFRVGWTSKASSDQRAGRAGRVGPGHCYRLFSSAVFNDYFKPFSVPEILRVPVEDIALQMKCMGINQVVHFPFPTPPSQDHLKSAETLLAHLGAINPDTKQKKVTVLGKLMAQLPVSPRFSKMLILAAQQKLDILEYMIMLVSGLSVGSPFIREDSIHNTTEEELEEDTEEQRTERREYFRIMQLFAGDEPTSDSIRLLRAIGAYMSEVYRSADLDQLEAFCERHFLRFKGMEEIRKLKQQLAFIMQSAMDAKQFPALNTLNNKPKPPSVEECSMIRQILLAGYGDHVAKFDLEASKTVGRPVYTTCFSNDKTQHLAIHPSSCIFSSRPSPKFIIYDTLVGREQRVEVDNSGFISVRKEAVNEQGEAMERIWMQGITIVNEKWLAKIGPVGMVNQGSLLSDPEPKYDAHSDQVMGYIKPTYGPKCWELPLRQIPLTDSEKKCWYFAKALLEGRVFGEASLFKLLQPYLRWKPNVITKSMSNKAVRSLVSALIVKKIDSKASLLATWSSNPRWLLSEYASWVPDACQPLVQKAWANPSQLSVSLQKELQRLLSSTKKSQPTIDQMDSDYDSDF
jgi:ATP-dependent RNA helicase DHX37/DHR1